MTNSPYPSTDLSAEKLVYFLCIGWGQDLVDRETTSATTALAFQKVTLVGLLFHELAASSDLEALLGATMGFVLWHFCLLPLSLHTVRCEVCCYSVSVLSVTRGAADFCLSAVLRRAGARTIVMLRPS